MFWTVGTLRPFRIGIKSSRGFRYTLHYIPAPYDRILAQLIAEDQHGDIDESHEALRRQSYAQQVLDKFVQEFESYTGQPIDFRSKVLTPILQRHLIGVTDVYLPALNSAIGEDSNRPTIGEATSFYLSVDPTDPTLIPSYRLNIVFIPEVRWHLATVMEVIRVGERHPYDSILGRDQDALMLAINAQPDGSDKDVRPPVLDAPMVTVIKEEGLEEFFTEELEQAVRVPQCGKKPFQSSSLQKQLLQMKTQHELADGQMSRKRAFSRAAQASISQGLDPTSITGAAPNKRRRKNSNTSSISGE